MDKVNNTIYNKSIFGKAEQEELEIILNYYPCNKKLLKALTENKNEKGETTIIAIAGLDKNETAAMSREFLGGAFGLTKETYKDGKLVSANFVTDSELIELINLATECGLPKNVIMHEIWKVAVVISLVSLDCEMYMITKYMPKRPIPYNFKMIKELDNKFWNEQQPIFLLHGLDSPDFVAFGYSMIFAKMFEEVFGNNMKEFTVIFNEQEDSIIVSPMDLGTATMSLLGVDLQKDRIETEFDGETRIINDNEEYDDEDDEDEDDEDVVVEHLSLEVYKYSLEKHALINAALFM